VLGPALLCCSTGAARLSSLCFGDGAQSDSSGQCRISLASEAQTGPVANSMLSANPRRPAGSGGGTSNHPLFRARYFRRTEASDDHLGPVMLEDMAAELACQSRRQMPHCLLAYFDSKGRTGGQASWPSRTLDFNNRCRPLPVPDAALRNQMLRSCLPDRKRIKAAYGFKARRPLPTHADLWLELLAGLGKLRHSLQQPPALDTPMCSGPCHAANPDQLNDIPIMRSLVSGSPRSPVCRWPALTTSVLTRIADQKTSMGSFSAVPPWGAGRLFSQRCKPQDQGGRPAFRVRKETEHQVSHDAYVRKPASSGSTVPEQQTHRFRSTGAVSPRFAAAQIPLWTMPWIAFVERFQRANQGRAPDMVETFKVQMDQRAPSEPPYGCGAGWRHSAEQLSF